MRLLILTLVMVALLLTVGLLRHNAHGGSKAGQVQGAALGGFYAQPNADTLTLEFVAQQPAEGRLYINPASFHVKDQFGRDCGKVAWNRQYPPQIAVSRGGVTRGIGTMGFG